MGSLNAHTILVSSNFRSVFSAHYASSSLSDVFYLFIWTFASERVFMYSALRLREKQQRNALKLEHIEYIRATVLCCCCIEQKI